MGSFENVDWPIILNVDYRSNYWIKGYVTQCNQRNWFLMISEKVQIFQRFFLMPHGAYVVVPNQTSHIPIRTARLNKRSANLNLFQYRQNDVIKTTFCCSLVKERVHWAKKYLGLWLLYKNMIPEQVISRLSNYDNLCYSLKLPCMAWLTSNSLSSLLLASSWRECWNRCVR